MELDRAIEEGQLALMGEFKSLPEVNEYALVVLAMNLDCWVSMEAEGSRFLLYADPAFKMAILEEFRLYGEEQSQPKRGLMEVSFHRSGVELLLLWAAILMVTFTAQTPGMVEKCCNSSEGIFGEGEWYRPFTALFLHGDAGHLLGNLMTSWAHFPEGFKSLGASTATFGALGLLAGSSALVAFRARSVRRVGGVALPFISGAILLGWFGAGGGDATSQVDVLAHVMGFGSGSLIGTVLVRNSPSPGDGEGCPA